MTRPNWFKIFFALAGILAIACGILGVMLLWEGLQMARASTRAVNAAAATQASLQNLAISTQNNLGSLHDSVAADEKVLNATLVDLHRVVLDAGGITTQARGILRKVNRATDAEIAYWEQGSTKLNTVLSTTNRAVENINKIIVKTGPAIDAFTETAQNAARVTGSPMLTATLANVADTTHSMAGVADDAHTETTLLVGATRKALTPRGKLSAIFHGLLGGTLTFAELAYYLTH